MGGVTDGFYIKSNSDSKSANSIDAKANNVTLNIKSNSTTSRGLFVDSTANTKYDGTINITATNKISISAESQKYAKAVGVSGLHSKINLNSNTLSLNAVQSDDNSQKSSYAYGIAAEYAGIIKVNADDVVINAENKGQGNAFAVYTSTTAANNQKSTIDIDSKNIALSVNANATEGNGQAAAIFAQGKNDNSVINIGSENTENLTIVANNTNGNSFGIASVATNNEAAHGGNVSLVAKKINVNVSGKSAQGVLASNGVTNGSSVVIGNANSDININVDGSDEAIGIAAFEHGNVNVNGNNFIVNAVSGKNDSIGIHVQNNGKEGEVATVNINSTNTSIKANDALSVYSGASLNVNGNIYTDADNALITRGNSNVNINTNGNSVVQLNGDINFNVTNDGNSGLEANSNVNINLNNKNSYLNGNIIKTQSGSDAGVDMTVSNITLNLSNGGTWNTDEDSFVNNLNLNGGVINLKGDENQTITVDKSISGSGTINLDSTLKDDSSISAGKFVVNSDATVKNTNLNVNYIGFTADDVKNANVALESVKDNVTGINHTNTIAEGDINGSISQTVDANGNKGAITQASNSKIASYSSMLTLATAQWRHELNSLSKRLGEVRSAPKSVGLWARAYGSEMEYGPQNVTLENNTIQLGFDTDLGSGFKVGSAISYTDGSSSAINGSADNDLYGFALYGTYLADNGVYVDLIGKYSRISNDFKYQNFSGSYDNNAYSLSVETGWNFKLNDTIFIEPQAEFTYGKILGDDFTASNGVSVNQEDTDTMIVRGGLRAGFNLPEDMGLIYAKASLVHDYDSENAFRASKNIAGSIDSVYVKDDLGGTWAEYGIGANINWTENCYTYFEIERTSGSDLTENYRWNLGTRYSF